MTGKELEDLKKEFLTRYNNDISLESIIEQLEIFEKGIPFLKLVKPCLLGDGVKRIPVNQHNIYIENYLSALDERRIVKFVPASGAATRMFKKQLSAISKCEKPGLKRLKDLALSGDEECKAAVEFFENINRFAFFDELSAISQKSGKKIEKLIDEENIADLVLLVAEKDGLNYANLPKGSILFHKYPDGARTAFEEHLIEALNYSADKNKTARIHFTISKEHEREVKNLFHSFIGKYSQQGWRIEAEFSFQSPSTDTISVTADNKPFRDEMGKIVFRPGGHGALLKNLNELNADIASIKNIDNVVPDHLRDETYTYKKILGGYLIYLQKKVFHYLKMLDQETTKDYHLSEIIDFIKTELDIDTSDRQKEKTLKEKREFLFEFLNRPIRVCGVVAKEKHPGGSPFWVEGADGELTKQIVETAQVNLEDENQRKIFESATHFNPVDILCSLKDYKGNRFDLQKFSNPSTGLITTKSKDGKELKALELPGLWNGGMYYWLTVFVEVPKITFNPVKEINDLLKPEHQPQSC